MAAAAGGETRAGIGSRLRAAREKKGLTLLQAAEKMHVDSRILESLEAEDFAALGAPVYARGHLRHYAELVDESPAELQGLYADATRAQPALPDLTRIARGEPMDDSRRLAGPAVIGVIAVAVVGLVWWILNLSGARVQPVTAASVSASSSTAVPTGGGTNSDDINAAGQGGTEVDDQSRVAEQPGSAAARGQAPASKLAAKAAAGTPAGSRANASAGAASAASSSTRPGTAVSGAATARTSAAVASTASGSARSGAAGTASTTPGSALTARTNASVAGTAPGGTRPSATTGASAAPTAARPAPAGGAAATPVSNTPATVPNPTPRAKDGELTLRFSSDSWAEVYDASGQRLFYDVGTASSAHTVKGPAPLHVVLGNASGVAVEYNGRPALIPASNQPDGSARFVINARGRAVAASATAP